MKQTTPLKRAIDVRFKKLDRHAIIPQYAHDGDVAMDLMSVSVEYDAEKDEYIYHTGLALETTENVSGFIFPRSSIHKTNFYLTNSVGIVDCQTYRGEVMAIFKHRDSLVGRVTNEALIRYARLPWYKRLNPKALDNLIDVVKGEFYQNPIAWAPYQNGERCCQIWFQDVRPVRTKEVLELSTTERGSGGFGSTGNASL